MTRKRRLGRLLVVALVVAAIVAPASLASAAPQPRLVLAQCGGIAYDGSAGQVLVPGDAGSIKTFYDAEALWMSGGATKTPVSYFSADLSDEAGPVVVFVDEAALQVLAPAITGGLRIVGTDFDDIICGSAYVNNVILGGSGDDVVPNVGVPGVSELFFDVIRGGLGDDTIWGGSGMDGILGGFGADTIFGFVPPSYELYPYVSILTDAPNDIYGGPGNDTISAGDSLFGHWVNGGGGDDTITGAALQDELLGGAGNDVISGKGGSDWIRGGAGNDTLYGDDSTPTSTSGDEIGGKSGDDMIMGSNGSDTLRGGSGNDTIHGLWGSDYILGGTGDDTAFGDLEAYGDAYGDADIIYGQAGNDTLYGHGGSDVLFGDGVAAYTAGSSLYGLEGTDKLYGGNGDDDMWGGLKVDTLYGGVGVDQLYGAYVAAPCSGDYPSGDEMYGGVGDDFFYGKTGDLDKAFENYGEGTDTAFGIDIIPTGYIEASGTCS